MYLSLILKSFNRNRKSKIVKSIFIIILLWFYAVLAGLSSPVIRAALMFSFLALAEISNRKISPVNIIACSALVILAINPYYLFDVGFQLSFAAMLGIYLVYIPLTHRWLPKNKIGRNIYQLILLSFSAQLVTLPLILYYFQQFPTYFLLANLIIVPIAGIILYATIVYTILLPIPFLANLIVYPVKFSIWFLNNAVLQVEELPGKLIKNAELDTFLLLLISTTIICFLFVLVRRNYKAIPAFLITIILMLSYIQFMNYQQRKHTIVRSFIMGNKPVLNIVQGNSNLFLGNEELQNKIGVKNSYFIKLDQAQIHFNRNDLCVTKTSNKIIISTPQAFIILKIINAKNPFQFMIVLNKNYQIISNENFSNNKLKEFTL
jgi:competence protein ComEC